MKNKKAIAYTPLCSNCEMGVVGKCNHTYEIDGSLKKPQHTPTPLKMGDVKEFYAVGSIPLILGENENAVVLVSDGNGARDFGKAKQYAQFIVRAVNEYEQLQQDLDEVSILLDRTRNSHDELLKIASAYRNLLRITAHTDGEIATFHHIESVIEQAGGR